MVAAALEMQQQTPHHHHLAAAAREMRLRVIKAPAQIPWLKFQRLENFLAANKITIFYFLYCQFRNVELDIFIQKCFFSKCLTNEFGIPISFKHLQRMTKI